MMHSALFLFAVTITVPGAVNVVASSVAIFIAVAVTADVLAAAN